MGIRLPRYSKEEFARRGEEIYNRDIRQASADPLIGISLMYGYELIIPILDGATFTLRHFATP